MLKIIFGLVQVILNESLRVSDTERGEPQKIYIRMPRRGAWTTEGNHDYSSPHPCKAFGAKEGRTQILHLSIYFVI